jgi:DNA-binding NtrC family response regulator
MFNSHRWPGNVRELSNAVQRFLVTPDQVFPDQPLTNDADDCASLEFERLRIARREAGDRVERAYVQALLKRTGGNVTRAAEMADMSRQMLQKLLRKHAID